MKKRILSIGLLLAIMFINTPKSYAFTCLYSSQSNYNAGFHYGDGGGIWTNTTLPKDVAKSINGDNNVDLRDLKCGEASARNILYIVELGDASVTAAARNAGITKVKFVDTKTSKIFVPLVFIPIMVRETKTLVYGE